MRAAAKDERGRYLYPDVYGKSVQESIWYASSPNARYLIDQGTGGLPDAPAMEMKEVTP